MSKQTENKLDGDAHAPNDGFTTKNLGVHCYAFKKCLVDHGLMVVVCSSEHSIRYDIVDLKRLVGHAIEASNGLPIKGYVHFLKAGSPFKVGHVPYLMTHGGPHFLLFSVTKKQILMRIASSCFEA